MSPPIQSKLKAVGAHVERARRRVPPWTRRGLHLLAVVALVALVVRHGGSVLSGLGRVKHVQGWPLALAIVAELGSLLASALTMRQLLRRDGIPVSLRALFRLTLAGQALSNSLPAGDAASTAYWIRELRLEGVERPHAIAALVRSATWNLLVLGALLVVAVSLVPRSGPLRGETTLVISVGCALAVAAALFGRPVARYLQRRLPPVPASMASGRRSVGASLPVVTTLTLCYWCLDCAALGLAMVSAGIAAPVSAVLVVYCLGQIASAVPVLPGGAGTVEATLILGFRAFGLRGGAVVAGVLLYRIVGTWSLVPVGWSAVALRRGARSGRSSESGAQGEPARRHQAVAAAVRRAGRAPHS